MGTHCGFCNELEINNRDNTIYILYETCLFSDYVPKTLKTNKNIPQGKLYVYRIKNASPLSRIAREKGLEKSKISHSQRGGKCRSESDLKFLRYID